MPTALLLLLLVGLASASFCDGGGTLQIQPPLTCPLPVAQVGLPFSLYTCGVTLTSALPLGLTWDPVQQLISGTPAAPSLSTLTWTWILPAPVVCPFVVIAPLTPVVQNVPGDLTTAVLNVQNLVTVAGNVV
jgi:hypothetical protein